MSDAVTLQPHQQRVLDKLYADDAPHGVIAYHSLGSGKTLTALEAFIKAKEKYNKPGLFITPASLVNNAYKEIKKHKLPLSKDDIQVMSYEKAARRAQELLENKYGLVAFDEAHRLRNSDTNRVRSLKPLIQSADKALMLTGTAGYNHPADIGALINLIDRDAKMPESNKDFEQRYVDPVTWKLKNSKQLGKVLNRYIDKYDRPADSKDFPATHTQVIRVPMSDKQKETYRFLENNIPIHLRAKMHDNLPMSLQEATNLNFLATGVRQASVSPVHHDVTTTAEDSPKLIAAADSMARGARTPRFRGMAYSNFREAGLNPYEQLLKDRGLNPFVFHGGLNAKQKKEIVDAYNAPGDDPRVLLVSSSGAEGLDLKGVRKLQILEPHFNQAKIDQIKGRGARYMSHAHLPENERHLNIEEYRSTMPRKWYNKWFGIREDTTIDDYLADASAKKQGIIDEMQGLIHS